MYEEYPYEITELNAELEEGKEERTNTNRSTNTTTNTNIFTPRLARCRKELDQEIFDLHESGMSEWDIARILGRHPTTIQMRLGAIKRERARVSDLEILEGPSEGGYLGLHC
jgi:hypothetical protein